MKLTELLKTGEKILINPCSEELFKLTRQIKKIKNKNTIDFRFITDKNGNIFVGLAMLFTHVEIENKFKQKIKKDDYGYFNIDIENETILIYSNEYYNNKQFNSKKLEDFSKEHNVGIGTGKGRL